MSPSLLTVACSCTVPWIRNCMACVGYLGCTFLSTSPSMTPCETRNVCGAAFGTLTEALPMLASAFVSDGDPISIEPGACTGSSSCDLLRVGLRVSLFTTRRCVTSGSASGSAFGQAAAADSLAAGLLADGFVIGALAVLGDPPSVISLTSGC